MEQDIRWKQRFSNFVKALNKLSEAVSYINTNFDDEVKSEENNILDEIVKEGLIQRFKYTHELAWNVMKDYLIYQGNPSVGGSRDATREAFQLNLLSDGHVWMDMISSRNLTSHTYNKETIDEIYNKIVDSYYSAFLKFQQKMEGKRSGEQLKLL
ncbi:MAG: nucleotidyltransferase substrate binding protein [Dysgonamonadaceae bacterium]